VSDYGCGGWAGWPSPLSRCPGGQTAGDGAGAGDAVTTGSTGGAAAGGADAVGSGLGAGAAAAGGFETGPGEDEGAGVKEGAGRSGAGCGASRVRSGTRSAFTCRRGASAGCTLTLRGEVRVRVCRRVPG